MLPEPYNTLLVILICVMGALHFSGKLGTVDKSPALKYMIGNYPKLPKIMVGLAIFVAVTKGLVLILNSI
ncbi:hypothetical protein AAEU28_14475 [Pseudoalteromonas sp. SS15]|uniref:Uncharacterized protein n=1 Tax=Thalassotalea insulae TaxID=2056778 RepID=A0ABQ6GN25_9GAMM|nr:hypothetical protein [Thalassotalea insulae]GLX76729.1 hypothetical protein tinsulaeT_00690 [Thalassotalea insulae]